MNNTHDWFDVIYSNPDKSLSDFANAGLSEKNIDLKNRDYYKDIPEIQAAFTDPETKKFDSTAYNKYYDSVATTYSDYIQSEYNQRALNGDFDVESLYERNKPSGKIYVQKVSNPSLAKQGIEGIFTYTEGRRSMREAAQANFVRDWKTGKSLGWTPNDDDKRGLLDFLGIPSLVEARWEEDGWHTDPFTNRKVKHYKGEWKTDSNGNPYYETLGDRDTSGKNFLHITDTLTIDGSKWNDFDPFDSDGITKNVGGQIMKTAFSIAPLLIPYVNTVYGLITGGALLSEALATFGKAGVEALDSDYSSNKIWRGFNKYTGYMNRFERSLSDKGSESMLNFEQAANLVLDVASQLWQQRAIAQIPSYLKLDKQSTSAIKKLRAQYGEQYLKKFGKTLDQAIKDGDTTALNWEVGKMIESNYKHIQKMQKRAEDLSKLYMVLTQTEGVYDTFKENNFDSVSTAIGLLAVGYGFHRLFKTSLGDIALKGLGLDDLARQTKNITKQVIDDSKSAFESIAKTSSGTVSQQVAKSKIQEFGTKFAEKFKTLLNNSDGIGANMLKEGLEEVSEEFLQDSVMIGTHYIGKALNTLGLKKTTDSYNFLNTNPLERYFMSAIGGAVGGGLFPILTKFDNWTRGVKIVDKMDNSDISNIITILQNPGTKVEDVLDIIDSRPLEDYGSTKLSANIKVNSATGDQYFENATKVEDSQAYIIREGLKDTIRAIDSFLKAEIPNMSQSDIIDAAIGKDMRARMLTNHSAVVKNIANDFKQIATNLVKAKAALSSTQDGKVDTNAQYRYNQAKKQYEDFISGKRSAEYVDRLAFLVTPGVNFPFLHSTIQTYALHRGLNYNALNNEEKKKLEEQYKYDTDKTNAEETAFNLFKYFRDRSINTLTSTDGEEIKNFRIRANKILDDLKKSIINSIPKEELDKKKELLESEFNNYDDFIKKYDLDPNNEAKTEEVKKELVEKYINNALSDWENQRVIEIQNDLAESNKGLGFDNNLLFADGETLGNFSNALVQLINDTNIIDYDTLNKLTNIFNNLNKFNPENLKSEEFISAIYANMVESVEGKDNNQIGNIFIIDNKDGTYKIDDGSGFDYTIVQENGLWKISEKDIQNGAEDAVLANIGYMLTSLPGSTERLVGEGGLFEALNNEETRKDLAQIMKSVLENSDSDKIKKLTAIDSALKTANRKDSKLYNLLSDISTSLLGENIFNIIKKEDNVIASIDKLSKFVIEDNLTKSQLKDMQQIIAIANSMLTYLTHDEQYQYDPISDTVSMIDIINYAKRSTGEQELGTISREEAEIYRKDLINLKENIDLIINLSNSNYLTKIQSSNLSLLRNDINLLWLLGKTENNKLRGIEVDGNPFFDFDLVKDGESDPDKLKEIYQSRNDSDENLKYADKTFLKMQQYYYDKFNKLNKEQKEELLRYLAQDRGIVEDGIFDFTNDTGDPISEDTEINKVSDEFLANFIISTFSYDPGKIREIYLSKIGNSKYAPFYNQYLSIVMAAPVLLNPEINKIFTEERESFYKDHDKDSTLYRQPAIFNIAIVDGDPGTGKTTSVAYFIDSIIKELDPVSKFIYGAVSSERASNLANNLGSKEFKTRSAIFQQLLTEEGQKKYNNLLEAINNNDEAKFAEFLEKGTLKLKEGIFTSKDFIQNTNPIYIIIDEYTQFSSQEIELMSKAPNVKILALGDSKQMGAYLEMSDGKKAEIYLTGYMFATPNLQLSIRCNNGYKKENQDILSNLVRRVTLTDDLAARVGSEKPDFNEMVSKLSEMSFRYYENIGVLQGEKVVESIDENTIKNILESLEQNQKVALITDKTDGNSYNIFKKLELDPKYKDKIVILPPNMVQGSEFDYTVLDIDYDNYSNKTSKEEFNSIFINTLKEFYTHVSRSKNGTFIVSKDNFIPVNKSEKLPFPNNTELVQEDISNYKTTITNVFNESLGKPQQTPTTDNSVKKQSTLEKTNILEEVEKKVKEVEDAKNKESKKFDAEVKSDENVVLYTSNSHIGLHTEDNGETFKIGVSTKHEDLNDVSLFDGKSEISRAELVKHPSYIAWHNIRSIMLDEKARKAYEDKVRSNYQLYNDIFGPFANLMGFSDQEDFFNAISNAEVYIKIEDDFDNNRDYQFTQPDYKRNTKKYARLVAEVKNGSESWIFTLADVSDSFIKSVEDGIDKIPINKSEIVLGNFSFLNENEKNESIFNTMNFHPSIHTSGVYYERQGNRRGDAFIYISSIPFSTDEEFENAYYNKSSEEHVYKVYLSERAYSIDDFFNAVEALDLKKHDNNDNFHRLSKLIPQTFPVRVLQSLIDYYNTLSKIKTESDLDDYNKQVENYNKQIDEENKEVLLNKKLHKEKIILEGNTTVEKAIKSKKDTILNILNNIVYKEITINESGQIEGKAEAIFPINKLNLKPDKLIDLTYNDNGEEKAINFTENEIKFMSKFKNISISKLIDELLNSDEWKYTKNTVTNEEFKKKLELTKEALKTVNNDYFNQPLDPLDLDKLSIFSINIKNHVKLTSYLLDNYKNNSGIIREAMTASKDFSYGIVSRTRSNEKGGVTDYSIKANASLKDVFSSRHIAERIAYIPRNALSKPQKSSIPLKQQYEDLVNSLITSEKFPNTADKLKELMLEETTSLRQDGTADENFNEKLENIHSKVKVINHKNGNHTYTTIYKDEDGFQEKIINLTNKREVYTTLSDNGQKEIINNLQGDSILLKDDGELIIESEPDYYYTFEFSDDAGLFLEHHSMNDSIRSKYGISIKSDSVEEAKNNLVKILENSEFISILENPELTDDEILNSVDDDNNPIYKNDVSDEEIIDKVREYQKAIAKSSTEPQVTITNVSPTEQLLQNSNLVNSIKEKCKIPLQTFLNQENKQGIEEEIDKVLDEIKLNPASNLDYIVSNIIEGIRNNQTIARNADVENKRLNKALKKVIKEIIDSNNINKSNCKSL